MQNLINAVSKEKKTELEKFITSINEVNELEKLTAKYGYYSDLIPAGKNLKGFTLEGLRAYLIGRKEKAVYKSIERKVARVKDVFNAGELLEVKISVEWKKSRMWGMNPTAEVWASFTDNNGYNSTYVKSGSIGGCGYDKESTAIAEALNQVNAVLKPLFAAKETNADAKNNELLGYGSGYGILPSLEGGVGVSCYPRIFEKVGYTFKGIAHGKTFDVYTITKNK